MWNEQLRMWKDRGTCHCINTCKLFLLHYIDTKRWFLWWCVEGWKWFFLWCTNSRKNFGFQWINFIILAIWEELGSGVSGLKRMLGFGMSARRRGSSLVDQLLCIGSKKGLDSDMLEPKRELSFDTCKRRKTKLKKSKCCNDLAYQWRYVISDDKGCINNENLFFSIVSMMKWCMSPTLCVSTDQEEL